MRTAVFALAALVLLSGCTAPGAVDRGLPDGDHDAARQDPAAGPEPTQSQPETPPGSAPDPETAPDEPEPEPTPGDPHGEVQVKEGETTTRQGDDGRFVAEKRVVLTNGRGDAGRIEVDLLVRYANVTVEPADVGGYTYTFDLDVRADTEAQARDGMDRVAVVHADRLDGGVLSLDTHVRHGPVNPLPVGSGLEPREQLSYDLHIQVPRHLAHGLDLHADYSAFVSGALGWTDLALDGDYTTLAFTDAPGLADLAADLDYSELSLRTDPAGGDWTLDMDYSSATLNVRGAAGYDLLASTTYSSIQVALPDVEDVPTEDGRTHKRTRDYDERDARVDADATLRYSSLALG